MLLEVLVLKAKRVKLAAVVPLVLKAKRVKLARRDLRDLLEGLVLKDRRVKLAAPDLLVLKDRRVKLAAPDLLDLRDLLAAVVPLALKAKRVNPQRQAHFFLLLAAR